MKVAIVDDWLTTYGGAARVLEQILALFPEADLYAIVERLPAGERGFLHGRQVRTSAVQRLPLADKLIRKCPWLLPLAVESLDVSGYDLVISSSHAAAKGVLTGPDQLHVCYCHTPIRYAWEMQHQYLQQSGLTSGIAGAYARLTLHYLRLWDVRTANGVDSFVANSRFIARRIRKVYRREATVVYPPVDVDRFELQTEKDNYYLAVSRFVAYKRMDVVVDAFRRMPDKKLLVVGEGPLLKRIRSRASANATFLGHVPDYVLQKLMAGARALVFAAEEDFGITLVEAQASGTPIICYGKGGALESVVAGRTGVFFDRQEAASLEAAVRAFDRQPSCFDPFEIRANAERFGIGVFRKNFLSLVLDAWRKHGQTGAPGRVEERDRAYVYEGD
jgi:glycosyltransferase involved in cell wall biosynthesis